MIEAKPEGGFHEDYKLIDELLLDLMRATKMQPADLWKGHLGHIAHEAIRRVRTAYDAGHTVTMTWATFFKTLPAAVETAQ